MTDRMTYLAQKQRPKPKAKYYQVKAGSLVMIEGAYGYCQDYINRHGLPYKPSHVY